MTLALLLLARTPALRLVTGALVLVFAILAVTLRAAPWLSIWFALLLALVVLLATRQFRGASLAPPHVAWLALVGLVLVANAHLYWLETHRARTERIDYVGVFVTSDSVPVRVGVGAPDLDVRLEGSLTELDRWSITIRRDTAGFAVTALDAVDWIERKVPGTGRWELVWGTRLDRDTPGAEVRDSIGRTTAVRLHPDGARGWLEWGGRRVELSRPDPVLDRRLELALRGGLPVGELPGSPLSDDAAGRDVILSLARQSRHVGFLTLRWPRYRLASRSGRWRVTGAGTPGALPSLARHDTLRLASGGKSWAFAVQPHVAGSVPTGTEIRFVRRPDPRLARLPPSDICTAGVACAIVSTRRMPPPVAQLDLGYVGLDTALYDFVGRIERETGDTARLVTARETVPIPYKQVVSLRATPRTPGLPRSGLLLRVVPATATDLFSVLLTLTALFALASGMLLALGDDSDLRARAGSRSRYAAAAWGMANAITVLLGLRLALGTRVAYAAPYYERGSDTAIGLWVAVMVLLVVLGRWPAWAPRLWRGVLRVRRRVSFKRSGDEPPPARVAGPGPTIGRPGLLGLAVLIVSLAVLGAQRRWAVAGGLFVAILAVVSWVAIGLTASLRNDRVFDNDPFEVLTKEVAPDQARISFLLTSVLAAILVLGTQMVGVSIVLAVVLGSLAIWGVRRARRLGPGSGWPGRFFAAAAGDPSFEFSVLAGVTVVVLLALARGAIEGPTILFALVFLLYLLAVRAGILNWEMQQHEAGERAATRRHGLVWQLVVVLMPLVLLLPFAAFDFGLGLVFFLPLFVTAIIAAGITYLRWPIWTVIGAIGLAVIYVSWSILLPSTDELRLARTFEERNAAFAQLGGAPGAVARRSELLSGPVARAVVRSLAAREPALLQQALAAAGPSVAREEIIRSFEQAWGGRAYAATGWPGEGLANTTTFGRGISAATSYAENTFSVFVMSEHGALGGLVVLALYGLLAGIAVAWGFAERVEVIDERRELAVLAIVMGGVLWLVLPAWYVAASNIGLVPLTGQNMPFLGLNAWSDVMLTAALSSAMIIGLFELPRPEHR